MHTNGASWSTHCQLSPQPGRAYRTRRKTQLSINQVSVYTPPPRPPFFLPSHHLEKKKNTYCFFFFFSAFSCISGQKQNFQRLGSKKRRHHTPESQYIYVCVCGEYIYCHAEESCREESLSMLVQHGKAPSPQGSPVSTGCWEVLGYWV